MASETDLLNDSLSQIGALPITAIDDGSVAANHCQRLFPALRDSLLRSHHWNFATRRAVLAAEATAPLFEFTYAYPLPADFLKIVEFNGDSSVTSLAGRYTIEGGDGYRKLLTNDSTVQIVYLARVTNPDQWDPIFYQVLATWLASKLALAIPKDASTSKALLETAVGVLLPLAMAVDGQEGTVRPFVSDILLRVRNA